MLDIAKVTKLVDQCWSDEIVPTLVEYIKIPNKSPAFDPDWAAHGYMDDAVVLFERWARAKLPSFPGASLEVVRLPQRTPVILIEIPGEGEDTVLLYGHLDKQPEMVGWTQGYGPWIPRLEGDKLYGRGGADDGYAMFGALSALLALKEQGVAHARCIILIEACEESGSYDLPYYVDHLAQKIGGPSLVVCLDSGCGNYDQLWLTTSLRGMASGTLTIEVLDEGVHSGDASGIVPSSFRILRRLLSRLEDEETGTIRPAELYVQIPPERVAQARLASAALGDAVYILGSYFFGRFVLGFFGITLPALRIAGGIIVGLSGWQLLNRSEQPAAPEVTNNASLVSMAFFPLTIPLTAGPGTITVAIALGAARAERSGIGVLIAIAAFFLATLAVAAIVLLCYRNADRPAQLVGQEGARVVTSLSAFLLLCVGVQIITAGAIDLARLAIAQD